MTEFFSPHSFLRTFLHVIFPSQCASCKTPLWDDPVPFVCRACWETVVPISGPCCPHCGGPFASPVALQHSPTHECGACRTKPPAFTKTWSLFPYQSPLKEAVILFKYHGKRSLTKSFLQAMIPALPIFPTIDILMPVPLHPQRLQEREYNQSLLLAHGLSQHLQIPLHLSCLLRVRATVPQTSLSKKERLTNLHRAFAIDDIARVKGQRILLIDDVFTTGTTLHECAKTLRKAGSGAVYGLTLARML
ncbi:MAG: ComF family protein [Nitrospirales bacterium]